MTFSIIAHTLIDFITGIKNRLFGLPPPGTDLVGYETLLEYLNKKRINVLDGDVVEIGSFLGGGTAKLARYFGICNKIIYAIDNFEPTYDTTRSTDGYIMSSLYFNILRGRNQEDVFNKVTRKYTNVVVIKGDSKKVVLPCKHLCFSFIDGCHSPDYVISDFNLVWDRTVHDGMVGFHDYGGNLPQTTKTIDQLIRDNKGSIKETLQIKEKCIILLIKK